MTLLPPTAQQQRFMDEELHQDAESTKRDIKAIKDWLDKQPHLPKHMGKGHVFFFFKSEDKIKNVSIWISS